MKDEEMAEEYAEEKVSNLDECRTKDLMRSVCKDGFLAGLKTGRLQWHYVKDGDLPKVYQKCYFIHSNTYGEGHKVIFSEFNINVLTGVYAFFLDEETGEETTDPCFYDDINDDEIGLGEVYAWKEIILPELPKESE